MLWDGWKYLVFTLMAVAWQLPSNGAIVMAALHRPIPRFRH
jgi:hypothetical protein